MKLWTDGPRTTDYGRRTDARVTGILLAFGSGELKSTLVLNYKRSTIVIPFLVSLMTELATCKTSVDYNVSLAKQAGLSLNWLQTQRDDCSHHKPNSSFAEVVNLQFHLEVYI